MQQTPDCVCVCFKCRMMTQQGVCGSVCTWSNKLVVGSSHSSLTSWTLETETFSECVSFQWKTLVRTQKTNRWPRTSPPESFHSFPVWTTSHTIVFSASFPHTAFIWAGCPGIPTLAQGTFGDSFFLLFSHFPICSRLTGVPHISKAQLLQLQLAVTLSRAHMAKRRPS